MGTVSLIILGVIVILVIYIIYLYWTSTTLAIQKTDFNTVNPAITSDKISGPANMNYTYSAWVWVNSWNTTVPHAIVYAPSANNPNAPPPSLTNGNNGAMLNQSYDFALYLDTNSPSLYCTLGSQPGDPSNTVVITNNFPLQTWVCIVVSVQNNLVDCYLNGKLIISQQTNQNNTPLVTPSFNQIFLGNGTGNTWDCQMLNFERLPTVVNPQQVWSKYLSGNGQSMLPSMNGYGVKVDLTQNNTVTKSYKLF